MSLLLILGAEAGPGTFTAAVAVEHSGVTGSATAEFDVPVFTADVAGTIGGAQGTATAEHDVPVFTADVVGTVGGAEGTATAEHDVPVFTSDVAATTGGAEGTATALFASGIFTASAAPSVSGITGSASATHVPPTVTATVDVTHSGVTGSAAAIFVQGDLFLASAQLTTGGATGHASASAILPTIPHKAFRGTQAVAATFTHAVARARTQGRAMKPGEPDSGCIVIPDEQGIDVALILPALTMYGTATFVPKTFTASVDVAHSGVTGSAAATNTLPPTGAVAHVVLPAMWLAGTAVWEGPLFAADVAATIGGAEGTASAQFGNPDFSGQVAATTGGATGSATASFSAGTKTASVTGTMVRPRTFISVSSIPPSFTAGVSVALSGVTGQANAITNTVNFQAIAAMALSGVTGSADGTTQVPVFTADVVAAHGGVTGSASVTRTVPSFTGGVAATVGHPSLSGTGTSGPPIERAATVSVTHSGVTGVATAQFAAAIRTAQAAMFHSGVTGVASAIFTPPGSGGTTPLSQPSWLEWTENYPYGKPGLAYDSSTYETIFQENNVLVATSSAQLAAHLATAVSNASIDAIHLDPVGNPYTYPSNSPLRNLNNHTLGRPLVIRTLPGSATQAHFPGAIEEIFGTKNVAFVDLYVGPNDGSASAPASIKIGRGASENILIERCVVTGIEAQGADVPSAPQPRPADQTKPVKNLHVRLCIMKDHWVAGSGLAHGIYTWNTDGVLLEGNLLDHNGWTPFGTRATTSAAGGGHQLKHNSYLNRPGYNLHIRYNITSRASSHGFHAKSGGYLRRNLSVKNPIGMQQGYGDDGQFPQFGTVGNSYSIDNLFVDADDINTTEGNLRGSGFMSVCIITHFADGNYFLDNTTSASNDACFYIERKYPQTIQITNNRARNWPWMLLRNPPPPTPAPNGEPIIIESGNVNTGITITSGAQALANTIKSTAYLDALKVNRQRLGIDIELLKDDMDTIRNGFIVP